MTAVASVDDAVDARDGALDSDARRVSPREETRTCSAGRLSATSAVRNEIVRGVTGDVRDAADVHAISARQTFSIDFFRERRDPSHATTRLRTREGVLGQRLGRRGSFDIPDRRSTP